MKPQAFIFMGRYGSGKGTQSKQLVELLKKIDPEHGVLYIETGAEFRKFFAEDNSYTAQLTKKVIESGGLMPEYMPIYIWGNLLVKNYTKKEHLVFDGTPRKLMEGKVFEGVFPFYEIEKPSVIYLDVDHGESMKRLSLRAKNSDRQDDSKEALEKRRSEYEINIIPTIEWFRTNPNVNFLDIDGNRSIQDIHTDIVKRLGLG